MPAKEFLLDNGLTVNIHKRRGNRNLRLTIGPNGAVRVSIPVWAPYKVGLDFANSRRNWILAQHRPAALLKAGQAVGKAHRLIFETADIAKASARVSGTAVLVRHPVNLAATDPAVQVAAHSGAIRALRAEARQLLPQRLADLAVEHGFGYGKVTVKRLKSRWGSCDHQRNIVLNLFLMQLPWDLIDYVLLHELAHTKVLKHGPDFWRQLEAVLPDAKQRRRRIRDYHPALDS